MKNYKRLTKVTLLIIILVSIILFFNLCTRSPDTSLENSKLLDMTRAQSAFNTAPALSQTQTLSSPPLKY